MPKKSLDQKSMERSQRRLQARVLADSPTKKPLETDFARGSAQDAADMLVRRAKLGTGPNAVKLAKLGIALSAAASVIFSPEAKTKKKGAKL